MSVFLVTGGAGFIGSALVRHIIKNTNDIVVNVDCLTYAGNKESLSSIDSSSRYIFEHADICDKKRIEEIFYKYKPDFVMHLAAESHVDRSIDNPSKFIHTNVLGTFNLLDVGFKYWSSLENKKKSLFKFHHISTDEVYGDLPHPDDDYSASQHMFREDTAYNPSSPYSASKAGSDHLVRSWNRTYNFPAIVTNCSNNYGPYHYPEKLIPLTILNAIEQKPLPVYGKGDQIRDWLYVEDHAAALLLVISEGNIGETYNIGGHNEIRNIDVVKTICSSLDELVPQYLNKNPDIQNFDQPYESLIMFVEDRPGHDRRYAIDATKISKKLGWKPKETFESGIKKTISWYLENQEWCGVVQKRNQSRKRKGLIK